ncbi:hypothetical protein L1857_08405 [Amycolatopsis thermalba]|uniref:Uncharacterized protein n=1 Tax=Amycolatopsis thermalba TaxID=944492 RepID=A0ABY4NS03_9PSEU|nr:MULTISPECIES: hypothetical protein [Amycolatopsis]UQS22837.1 hypothetical protein L1857_08405 [Amycolatopsis thermalba]
MSDTASVYVQDHSFVLGDADAETPFEAMDYSTGVAGVMQSAALLYAGVDRGYVTVSVDAAEARPALETPQQWTALAEWDDVAEISLEIPNGELRVDQLEYRPGETRIELPVLSAAGPGSYRVRIHASGRDRHFDQAVDDSGESFHLVVWPQPPAPPLIIKATSACGYGLRLNQNARSAAPSAETAAGDQRNQDER